jgi:hypothetical protein
LYSQPKKPRFQTSAKPLPSSRIETCFSNVKLSPLWSAAAGAEQWIKEGKQAVKMTRLSCHRFRSNQVRLGFTPVGHRLESRSNPCPAPPAVEIFVAEYLVDLNATRAAIAIGYSKKCAHMQGSRLLRNVKVAEEIERKIRKRVGKLDISRDRVLFRRH